MNFFDRETRTCPSCDREWQALAIWVADMRCDDCQRSAYAQRLAEINENRSYTVESIGGACPTQADGRTADGRPFYFRARHGEWAIKVGPADAPTNYTNWPSRGEELVAHGDDPSGGFMEWVDVVNHLDAHLAR
jgi:hypothetical protein